jgi:GxxExxY protein
VRVLGLGAIEAPAKKKEYGVLMESLDSRIVASDSLKEYPHRELTERIIGCAIQVHRELHAGYVERVYENALAAELDANGIRAECQVVLPVFYRGTQVGEHRADMIVDGKVVLELKAVSKTIDQHRAQIMSTMRAAELQVGLLLNFGKPRMTDGITRVVL